MFVLHFDIIEARSEPGEWREQNAGMIVTMSFKNVFVTIHCKISRSMNVQVSHYAYVYVASHSLGSKMCWTSTKTDTAVIVGWQFNKMQNLTEKKNSTGKRNCIIIILSLSDSIRRCWMKQQLNMLLMRNNSSSGGSKRSTDNTWNVVSHMNPMWIYVAHHDTVQCKKKLENRHEQGEIRASQTARCIECRFKRHKLWTQHILLDKTQGISSCSETTMSDVTMFFHKVCSPRLSPRIDDGKNNVVIIIGWTLEFSAYNTLEQ